MTDHDIHGHCDAGFEAVRDAFAANFAEGLERGASVCVVRDGACVVDLWAGHADAEDEAPWERDTIVNVYSTTKTMAALTVLLLADRGALSLETPVHHLWPEFAEADKRSVTVAHCLAHTAGLSGLDEPVTPEDLYDHEKICTLLARQTPWWTPGSAPGYHAITQGYLLGEIVRRATGHSLGRVFADELAGPLGADFHIGTGEVHDARIGRLVPPEADLASADGSVAEDSIAARTFANPATSALQSRETGWRRAEIPAANGHGNARSVARVQSLLACGGELDGRRLLSEAGARRALEVVVEGQDLVLGMPTRYGMGYGRPLPHMPLGPNEDTVFWGGWGGSLVVVDLEARTCWSYVMNRMVATLMGDPRTVRLGAAVLGSLAG